MSKAILGENISKRPLVKYLPSMLRAKYYYSYASGAGIVSWVTSTRKNRQKRPYRMVGSIRETLAKRMMMVSYM